MSDTAYAIDADAFTPPAADLPSQTDVLVIGAGFTGLSAALHLAEAGRTVTVVDKGAIADGASGRNGGQLHPGQRRDQEWLTARLGVETADRLWDLANEAIDLVHDLRARLDAPCAFRPGLIEAAHTSAAFADLEEHAAKLHARYGIASNVLDRDALAEAIGSARYAGGIRDGRGGHLNPLAFARALARGAANAGATLLPHAEAQRIDGRGPRTVSFRAGTVRADTVLIAGNGMMSGLDPRLDASILPLVNHIAATQPLERPLIPGGEAVADTRNVIRYWREDAAGRVVFGGGETFLRNPRDVAAFVRPYLVEVYPQLATTPIEIAWSGTLGITQTRCPLVRRLDPGLYAAAGFSGQGVGLGTFAGKVIAEAVRGDSERLDVFAKMPVPPLPGGRYFKRPLGLLAMTWFALRDRLAL